MITMLLFYGGLELLTLTMRNNTLHTTNEVDSFFDGDYTFHTDKTLGLQLAFGLTAYDGNYEALDVPEYVSIKAKVRSWSPDEDAT